jgi:hypothetical protein
MAVMKGRMGRMSARLAAMMPPGGMNGSKMTHSWKYSAHQPEPHGHEIFGLVMGLAS